MRAFVGIAVPHDAPGPTSGALAAPDHLTLRFLGEVDVVATEDLIGALGPAVAAVAPFEFFLEGVGAFPDAARPRVVWRGVSRGAAELQVLAHAVRAAVARVGLPDDDTPFVPHVTLFRVRSARDRERAARLLGPDAVVPPPTRVAVNSVALVESRLTPSGAVHREVASFPCSGGST